MVTFQDAVTRLNSCNLDNLLCLSSILSTVEVFGGKSSDLFPMLNNEKCRLFADAILASRAAPYKSKELNGKTFTRVLDALNEGLYDPRLQEVKSGDPREEMLYGLTKFFSRMANIQIRQQESPFKLALERLLVILDILPQKYTSEFPPRLMDRARAMPKRLHQVLGCELDQIFVTYLYICQWYEQAYRKAWHQVTKVGTGQSGHLETRSEKQARTLVSLIEQARQLRPRLVFSSSTFMDFLRKDGVEGSQEAFDAFLWMFATAVTKARVQRSQKREFTLGPEGWNLSPLERYPIIELSSTSDGEKEYIIPNVRTFIRSISDVLHFAFLQNLGNEYSEYRGAAEEVYLRMLVSDKLHSCVVIPETTYRRGKDEVRGPDLVIIERQTSRLIVIETKARRLLAETRFTMDEEVFDDNFKSIYDALKRLPQKIKDLHAGIPEYSTYQNDIDLTQGSSPICVVLIGESPYLMSKIIRYRAEKEADHPIKEFPFPYCIMSLESFERCVELSSVDPNGITCLLEEFWEDSGRMELDANAPENFRHRRLSEEDTFARSLLSSRDADPP